jgi:ubiquinone/menaquinone biosynthesis C-methylase UbiE
MTLGLETMVSPPTAVPEDPVRYLDMAGGTGDIAFRIAEALRAPAGAASVAAEIVVSDINPSMLGVGEQRALDRGLITKHGPATGLPAMTFQVADAESLPFEDGEFDSYTIAFGIRNVTHVDVSQCAPLVAPPLLAL